VLTRIKTLKGFKLKCSDGEIGKVKECYFDDRFWTIRYLVVDTGNWLEDRRVLVSPYALIAVNTEQLFITVDLTKKQIEDSPSLNSDKPVSRQFEEAYWGYYGWPTYWGDSYMWGYNPFIERDSKKWRVPGEDQKAWDPYLRSTEDVTGHYIQAEDGDIGHVEDFVIDDVTWAIRYLVIDTENWLPGKKVLVSPQWIERVSWEESKVFVNLRREAILKSPEYTAESLLTRHYEQGLHQHYKRREYWVKESIAEEHSPC
jgi:hypothetical protein